MLRFTTHKLIGFVSKVRLHHREEVLKDCEPRSVTWGPSVVYEPHAFTWPSRCLCLMATFFSGLLRTGPAGLCVNPALYRGLSLVHLRDERMLWHRVAIVEQQQHNIQGSVTTPHFHKCQGEPMKKAKNSQGFGKAMIIENQDAKVNNE